MAAPPSTTLPSLSGHYKLNKSLSTPSSISHVLSIQGTSSLLQHAIASTSITLEITQPGENEYRVKQSAISASIPGTTEQYVLDNEWRTNHDPFFGDVRGRSRWIGREEAGREYPDLEGEWEGGEEGGKLILAEGGKADGNWDAVRLWGFEVVGGERRYTQRVKAWNKRGEEAKVKMVYDFTGKVA